MTYKSRASKRELAGGMLPKEGPDMVLYHRTNPTAAESILNSGFKDGSGTYGTGIMWHGVWLSNVPLDENSGARGDVLLRVHIRIPAREMREQYEWRERGKPYREFLIPAKDLNPLVKEIEVADDRRVARIKHRKVPAKK